MFGAVRMAIGAIISGEAAARKAASLYKRKCSSFAWATSGVSLTGLSISLSIKTASPSGRLCGNGAFGKFVAAARKPFTASALYSTVWSLPSASVQRLY